MNNFLVSDMLPNRHAKLFESACYESAEIVLERIVRASTQRNRSSPIVNGGFGNEFVVSAILW